MTATTNFAALGYELGGGTAPQLISDGFSVRYDAAANQYVFDLPAYAPGSFQQNSSTPNDRYFHGGLANGAGDLWPVMMVLKASPTNPEIQLSYTSFAYYLQSGPMWNLPHGYVAFGIPTPAGAVPLTGSATYTALVRGSSLDGNFDVGGSATLQFNFGNGTLAGHFDPAVADWDAWIPIGRYDFVNTVFSSGSTTFSGGLQLSGAPQAGSFEGLFTGPNAQELMSRWSAPFLNPATGQWSSMFGIWVGERP